MNKNLLLLGVVIASFSCSTSQTEIKGWKLTNKIVKNYYSIDNTGSLKLKGGEVEFSNSKTTNCFIANGLEVKPDDDIITVMSEFEEDAINYFYKNKATWNIKQKRRGIYSNIEMIAESETQIKYEAAYCGFSYYHSFLGIRFREIIVGYSSFRLIK